MIGFWIQKIAADGVNKVSAIIELKKGANVITGPSDTGKSYVFSLINYVLGRSDEPDADIPEGRGYDHFSLEVVSHSDGRSTNFRDACTVTRLLYFFWMIIIANRSRLIYH